jgi:hypothetical protein
MPNKFIYHSGIKLYFNNYFAELISSCLPAGWYFSGVYPEFIEGLRKVQM